MKRFIKKIIVITLLLSYTLNIIPVYALSKNETIFDEYTKVEPIKLKNIASILCYEKTALKYEQDGKYGLISFEGKQITKNLYDSIDNLQATEGKMLVKKENKFGDFLFLVSEEICRLCFIIIMLTL